MGAETLNALAVAHAAAGDRIVAEDWLGEAANQLLGRIKNRLLGHGLVVSIALPTVLRGVELKLMAAGDSVLCTYGFESPAGDVCAWLDVLCDPSLTLVPNDDPALHSAPEGAVELF
jgi:hypothetical protein